MADYERQEIDYDKDKVDEMILALFYLTTYEEEPGLRVWKSMDWSALSRLHQKGYISNPLTKTKSVVISKEAAKLSEKLFQKYFGTRKDEPKEEKEK